MFDEKQRITHERDVWLRLLPYYRFVPIPYVATLVRQHERQVSNTNKEILDVSYKKREDIIRKLPKELLKKLAGNENNSFQEMEKHFYLNNLEYWQKAALSMTDNPN